MYSNNTSGETGVYRGNNNHWVADWFDSDKKRIRIRFYDKDYDGEENSKNAAIIARKEGIANSRPYIIASIPPLW